MTSGVQIHRGSRRFIAVAAACASVAFGAPLGWNELVGGYPKDLSLNAAKERVKELNSPLPTQFWQDMELRYDAKRADLRKQELGLRVSPSGWGELASNRSLARSRRHLGDAMLRQKTAEAIRDRYKLALDWLYQTRQRRYHLEMADLCARRTEALAKTASDVRFEPEDLVDAQVKRTEFLSKAEGDLYSLAQIENHMRQFVPGMGEVRLEGALLSPREIESILSAVDPAKSDSFPDVAIAAGKMELAQAKSEQEIASSRRWVSYLGASYTFDVDENKKEQLTVRDNIAFGFGIKVPLFDGGSQDIARRKADVAAARLDFQDDKEDVQRKVAELRISIGSRLRQIVVLDSFAAKIDAGGLFAEFAIKAGGDPLLVLSAKSTSIESAWRSDELRFLILQDYLDILHLTGALVRQPDKNHLLAKTPSVAVSEPVAPGS